MAKATEPLRQRNFTGSKAKNKTRKPVAVAAKSGKRGRSPLSESEIHEIFRLFQLANPEPKGELEHINPFTLLVAVVLSAQATDAGVNKATRALFEAAPTP